MKTYKKLTYILIILLAAIRTQAQTDLTTAATHTISGDELRKTAAVTLKEALYGRLPGLTVLNKAGHINEDNNGANLNIRGIQTTSENNVLTLVDGIKRNIDYLTIEEIESVTVLRDAAAVAIYGYEGVNGAILITTKRGTHEGLTITASYNHKFTFNPQTPQFVDAFTYASALNQARVADGLTPMYNPYELNAFAEGTHPYYYPNVNWKKQLFKNIGSEDRVNLGFDGGNEKLKFFAMLDYTDNRGLLKETSQDDYNSQLKYSKANIRANLDVQLTPTTTMQVNALGSFIETNNPAGATANQLTNLLYQTPASAFPVQNDPQGQLAGIWGGNTTYGGNNIAAIIQASGYRKTHARLFQGDMTLTQDFSALLQGLTLAVRFGYDNYSDINENNAKGYQYGYQRYNFDTNGAPAGLTTYQAGDQTGNLSFSNWIDRHHRASYLGITATYQTTFRHDDNFNTTLTWNQTNETSGGQYQTYNRMNWIATLHYDLQQKYIADLTLAANGSNRSYPEKWAFSPTLALGYIYANNPESNGLSFGKIRLSAGLQHTDYVPSEGLWIENYDGGGGDYYFGADGGTQYWGTFISHRATPSFKHETAWKFNTGTDMRIGKTWLITADAYYQYRDNILLPGDGLNSTVTGIPSAYINYGRVASYGIETHINWTKQLNNDITLNAGTNITWGRNKILRTIENVAYDYLSAEGHRVNQAWALQTAGFFKDEADIAASPTQQFDTYGPGDIKYKDINNDNIINENDRQAIGYDTEIPEFNYALNIGLQYKNFGINLLLQGAAMYTQYCNTTGIWTPMVEGANLTADHYRNSWGISENPKYPRLTSQVNNNNYRENDLWYKNVNFLKLRNCEVYYHLPLATVSKIKATGCKLFIKGENLFTISNLKETDPENITGNYPTLMGINIGLKINF